ncbi:MAG: hypothetical protein K2W95_14230 [Candidatus Obscuribacterales bacterium]|nr:hypothetical protein [Candidatus Obscuribacterales bacterium]
MSSTYRSVVKHSYVNGARAMERARAHLRYVQFRPGKDRDERARKFFDGKDDKIGSDMVHASVCSYKKQGFLMHKLIISPGAEKTDIQEYVREIMHEIGRRKGQELEWYGVRHDNTENAHCHVVVMGVDKNGRRVRFDRRDYEIIKSVGDEYLERNRLLLTKEPQTDGDKPKFSRFLDRLKTVFGKNKSGEEKSLSPAQKRLKEQEQRRRAEVVSLGEQPDFQTLESRTQIENERRERLRQERQWREYSRPITVTYSSELVEIPVQYNWNTSLELLRDLESDYKAGHAQVRAAMTEYDAARLEQWIKDQWRDQKALEREAAKVKHIRLNMSENRTVLLSRDLDLDYLKKYQKLDRRGDIHLLEPERKALSDWIREQTLIKHKQERERKQRENQESDEQESEE